MVIAHKYNSLHTRTNTISTACMCTHVHVTRACAPHPPAPRDKPAVRRGACCCYSSACCRLSRGGSPAVVIQGVRQSDARCVERGLAGRRRKGMNTNTRQSAQPRTYQNYLSYQTATTHSANGNDNNHDSGHDPHTHTCVAYHSRRKY